MQQATDMADTNMKVLRKNPKSTEKHRMRTPAMNAIIEQRMKNKGAKIIAVNKRKGDRAIKVMTPSSVNATG